MGSSNFDKSEKLLKEMHGKAKTLLKLPKAIKVIGLDEENKNLLKHWKKLENRYSRKFNEHRKNHNTISIKKKISKNTIRIGIEQDKDIFHFDYDYYNTDIQDTILIRELFPIFTRKSAKNENIQMIATIWALSITDSQEYIQILKKIPFNKNINIEVIKWIEQVLVHFNQSKSNVRKFFGQFLLTSCLIVNESNLFAFHDFFDLYLLWFMVNGCTIYHQFFISEWKCWLFFEMLEFFYNEKTLCQKFGINKHNDKYLALIHLCTQFIVEKESKVDRKLLTKIYPNYSQMEKALGNFQFSEFLSLIPESVIAKDKKFVEYTLLHLLTEKGIIVEGVNFINMPRNTERNIEITIENISDWPLKDVKFKVMFNSMDRLFQYNIDHQKTGEHKAKLNVLIKSADKTGKAELYISMFFKSPVNPDLLHSSHIRNIDIDIQ